MWNRQRNVSYCDFMWNANCSYITRFNIFKFYLRKRRTFYLLLYRSSKLRKSSSSRTLPKVARKWLFPTKFASTSDSGVQACRQSFGERKVYYWEEGKLSEFTSANYNRPSRSITVQTLYKKTERVSQEWRWTNWRCWKDAETISWFWGTQYNENHFPDAINKKLPALNLQNFISIDLKLKASFSLSTLAILTFRFDNSEYPVPF